MGTLALWAMEKEGIMALAAPIKLTLYDAETNEAVKEYTRMFVPWKILKTAVKLAKTIKQDDLSEEDVDNIAALVCATFGDQFTVDELNKGADIGEMMTVLFAIIQRAEGLMPNPPPAGGRN